jgi:hypothetical protein
MRVPALPALLCAGALFAQAPAQAPARPRGDDFLMPAPAYQSDAAKLIKEIAEHQELMKNLEEMCDSIGPRLTGSEKLRTAQKWAAEKLKGYGAVNVHEEAYDFGKPWTRGVARARLLNANGQELHVAQWAWTEPTMTTVDAKGKALRKPIPGPVRGEVALLEAKTLDELKAALPGLAGKIVLALSQPRPTPEQRKDMEAYIKAYMDAMKEAKFAVLLRDAGKKSDLLNMSGSPDASWRSSTAPAAVISSEHANLLKRLIARGQHPEVEIELGGRLGDQPVQAYNVVAEIRGSERPEEVVIVGGHQDSWDLGTGATDNGTGTVVAMEVLRAMAALKLQPKRTLRVVLFSGEEEGLLGSKAYAKAHADEMRNLQAVLIDDMGSGRIKGFPDMGVEAVRGPLAAAMAAANGLGAVELPAAIMPGATDHWPFHQAGVPAFAATQEALDYHTHTHHSQVDTVDHVVKEDVLQGAQVMAATAWGLLNGERLPHHEPVKAR